MAKGITRLHAGQVRGIELGVLGARYVLLNIVAAGRRRYGVLSSGNDQQRHLDSTQLITKISIAYRRAVGGVALG